MRRNNSNVKPASPYEVTRLEDHNPDKPQLIQYEIEGDTLETLENYEIKSSYAFTVKYTGGASYKYDNRPGLTLHEQSQRRLAHIWAPV